MKWTFRRAAALLAVFVMALSMAVPVQAASSSKSSKKNISSVAFDINMSGVLDGDEVLDEDDLESVITLNTNKPISITEIGFSGRDEMAAGDKKKVYVTLEIDEDAKDDYRFKSGGTVKINSGNKYVDSAKISSVNTSKGTMKVAITLLGIISELYFPEELDWNGNTASWSKVDAADRYTVRLFRNGSSVGTVTTTSRSANMHYGMTKTGDYTFKVRAESSFSGVKSSWSEESDERYIDSDHVYRGSQTLGSDVTHNTEPSQSESAGPAGPSSGGSSSVPAVSYGWQQDANGWRYLENGSAVYRSWREINSEWYYFNERGYMATGWVLDGGRWYYLNTSSSEGTLGAMRTGWIHGEGKYYYLNTVSDGTKGAMLTGFQTINGRQYYFDPVSGELWMNREVPDGRYAGSDGTI